MLVNRLVNQRECLKDKRPNANYASAVKNSKKVIVFKFKQKKESGVTRYVLKEKINPKNF